MLMKIYRTFQRFNALSDRVIRMQEALGRIESRQVSVMASTPTKAEFRVFSQWGEDGIIQYLIDRVPIERQIFVEFGVENYVESNTRFLLTNNHWSGLVIDGSQHNIDYIKRDVIYWAANLKALCEFITKDNINSLLRRNGIVGDIGILSIDIDGNDYWVFQAIDVISPRIIICEYNSLFGPVAQVTTPYDPTFVRDIAHHSKVYYGASISALNALASSKGYSLVAGNCAGNNVFFVRNDMLGNLRVYTPHEIFRKAQFREFHDEHGKLTFCDYQTQLEKIAHLPLFDIEVDCLITVGSLIKRNNIAV